MPLIFDLTNFKIDLDVKSIIPYFTIVIAFLLVSKLPTLSLKKISISPKSTPFILLSIGIVFIALLYYTFETLLAFGFVYLIFIPISYFMYKKQNKKNISKLSQDDSEDVL